MEPFLDWYGIWPGQSGRDEDGYSFFEDPPLGVRLRVQEARKSAVFFRREQPWEQHTLNKLTILRDGDRYRMWYAGRASDDRDEHFSCYAESEPCGCIEMSILGTRSVTLSLAAPLKIGYR